MPAHGRLIVMNAPCRVLREHRGQASVELMAALPVVLVVGMAMWQFAVAGHAWWRVNESARLAARAVYVGEQRGDGAAGRTGARRAVKAMLGDAARVAFTDEHAVRVSSRVPLVWPFSAIGDRSAPLISVASRFGA